MAGAKNKKIRKLITSRIQEGKDWRKEIRAKMPSFRENSNYFRIMQRTLIFNPIQLIAYLKA